MANDQKNAESFPVEEDQKKEDIAAPTTNDQKKEDIAPPATNDHEKEAAAPESHPIENIVLLGRTGNGKSATGNSIARQKVFISKPHAAGVTMECQTFRAVTPEGPILNIIDTPGTLCHCIVDVYGVKLYGRNTYLMLTLGGCRSI